ncbi:hypothetical protein AAVH_43710, partial [Aphelenchoides avenae]
YDFGDHSQRQHDHARELSDHQLECDYKCHHFWGDHIEHLVIQGRLDHIFAQDYRDHQLA